MSDLNNDLYANYVKQLNKKASKKAKKKAAKKAAKKSKKVSKKEFIPTGPAISDQPRTKILSYTETGKPSYYTEEERKVFQMRIDNEKKNIWRMNNQDPLQIIKYCEANVADERNAAIRFARQAALKWAKAQQARPF